MSPFTSTTSSSTWRKRSMLTSTIALLACTLGLVDSACVSLAGSKACPAYAGYQVDTSIATEVKSGGIIMQPFNTLAEFDQAAMNATGFQTSQSCTGYNSSVHIPYQTTILCAYAVQSDASLACPNNATTSTTMCISSCKLYEQELTSMVQRLCPTDESAKNGVSTMNRICTKEEERFWIGLQGKDASTCIDSAKNEAATCGLVTDIARCDYCKNNQTAACCADAASTCNYPSTSTTNSASSSTSGALVPPSGTSGSKDSDSKSGLSTGQLGGIIGGAVAGVILLAAIVFVCIRRSRRHNQSPYGASAAAAHGGKGAGVSRKLSNSSNGYNISNPKFQEEAFPIPMTTLPPINMEPKNLGPIHPSGAMMAGAAAGAGMAGIGAAAAGGAMGHDSTGKPSYCQALYPYQASMADELDLTPGDVVNVQRVFDDGWAVGMNMNTSNEGAFPVVCVMFVDESDLNQDDDEFEDVNMHSMPPMTLREEDQEGRRSPSQGGNGRNSPRSSLPSRSSSPVHLPRRNSSIRDSTVIIPGSSLMTSSPLAGGSAGGGRLTPTSNVRDTMLSDASSMNRWWEGEGNKQQ